jgi:exonuclease SbcD
VPFLTEGDVRTSEAGEDTSSREKRVTDGIARHYELVAQAAEQIRAGRDIPVVAMGHLYAQGGKLVEDDGVRVTYVGTLGGVSANIFSSAYDYVALGHLHVPQIVGECAHIRYSGSPLAMGFGEAGQQKSLCKIVFDGKANREISLCEIPEFHKMENICGTKSEIRTRLMELAALGEEVYVAVTYDGEEYIESVSDIIEDILEEQKNICCLCTKNLSKRSLDGGSIAYIRDEVISDLNEHEMFGRLLDVNNIPEEERPELVSTFNELLELVQREG